MTRLLFLLLSLALVSPASSGDLVRTPTLRDRSGYIATNPPYRLVGIEDRSGETVLWVVADADAVLSQRTVNRIIRHARDRLTADPDMRGSADIYFYSSVKSEPRYPAFISEDLLATYSSQTNRTSIMMPPRRSEWTSGPAD